MLEVIRRESLKTLDLSEEMRRFKCTCTNRAEDDTHASEGDPSRIYHDSIWYRQLVES